MRILLASVVNQDPAVFQAHLATLAQQRAEGVQLDLAYIFDVSDPNAETNAQAAKVEFPEGRVILSSPKPADAAYGTSEATHNWSVPTFYWLAREKQRLLDLATQERYDAVLLADSDLLLGTGTLGSLLAADKDVVSAVFWTRWTPNSPPLPQVWMSHPYEFQGRGYEAHEFLRALNDRALLRVTGLGACTLIRSQALGKVGFWPLIDGLPQHGMWQGEDRHFCVRAARNHVELWADAWPDVWHCYRPSDQENVAARSATLVQPHLEVANFGDLISATLEPCEEPALVLHREHIRGRLGALRLLPEIEQAIRELPRGGSAFVKVHFPLWYPIEVYRGVTKLVRVTLHDIKPYTLAPTLDEWPATPEAIAEHFLEPAVLEPLPSPELCEL